MTQTRVLHTHKTEANRLLRLAKKSPVFAENGIEVYTVSAEPEYLSGVIVMVRAETDMQAGIGKGYLLALSER